MAFGTTANGDKIDEITIADGDLSVSILTFGAIIQDVRLSGIPYSLTLGSSNIDDYFGSMGYHGALVGPIANRISNARVRLEGMMYELERNENGIGHLHSGSDGVHKQLWTVQDQSANSVTLTVTLPDGVNGLPGHRKITATFTVTAPASLTLEITGETDTKTLMNFANHSYWNLDGTPDWDGHSLRIAADHYLPINDATAPTGEICDVSDTDMDFRNMRLLEKASPALDHNFCLSHTPVDIREVLTLTGASGVAMSIATTEPGIQIYDGGGAQRPGCSTYEGLAIEPQRWPDAPNHRGFPSITVSPDAPYRQTTRWSFRA
ncbi:aldose epimerase family protein [Loktanella sp. S4079]|uniref:aldose epimerase family protein n=1 Tax=Loktanella sp. S4079 TaxID=579483 RepID=UPI0005FA04A0|nr:aldose epimerase family protein [Loktanella sp. S4079]KJZ20698.1 aldose epimerase [Loktanella sp. S4079]